MSEIKLRPCPFCGGAVWFNHNMDLEPDGIRCGSCRYVLRYSRIRVMPRERFEVAMRKMADHWNGRRERDDSD